MPDGNRYRARRRYARVVVLLRFLIVPAWLLGAFAANRYLPSPHSSSSLSGALPSSSSVTRADEESVKHFVPFLSETVIVQHKSSGLSLAAQLDTVKQALAFDAHAPRALRQIGGAIPITNTLGIFPSSHQSGTTALTYLLFNPSVHAGAQDSLARSYAHRYLGAKGDGLVGVTGPFVDVNAQARQISAALPTVELAVIALIVVIVGLAFRSVFAPVITLLAAGTSYFVSQGLLGLASTNLGVTVPAELQPLIVVLILGVVTDYSVFFLSGFKDEMRSGHGGRNGAVRAVTNVAPLVLTAGVTVAASVAVVMTAHLSLFAALGPGLAISVIVAALVAVSFVPAALSLLGSLAYWPSRPQASVSGVPAAPTAAGVGAASVGAAGAGAAGAERAGAPAAGATDAARSGGFRLKLTRALVLRPVAAVVVLLGVGALAFGVTPLRRASIGLNLLRDLPSSTAPVRTANAAAAGFSPGIVAPTEVLLHGKGVADDTARLALLQHLIAKQHGVSGVLGPGLPVTRADFGLFRSANGNYARYLVVFSQRPYAARAISDLKSLQSRMGSFLSTAGLGTPTVAYAGDTALAADTVSAVRSDLVRIGLLTLAVDFLVLVIFLRSVSTPLLLVAASALVVAASFGIGAWVFGQVLPSSTLGSGGFTFYVPFAAEVLLISFGSDYNLFLVGRIWEMASELPLRHAIAVATTEAASAINVAGLALAGSFAALAFVNLGAFRQLAFVMVVGLLIDTFLVRSLLVPASLSLMGSLTRWPRRRHPKPAVTRAP